MCFDKGYWGMAGCSGVYIYAHRSILLSSTKDGERMEGRGRRYPSTFIEQSQLFVSFVRYSHRRKYYVTALVQTDVRKITTKGTNWIQTYSEWHDTLSAVNGLQENEYISTTTYLNSEQDALALRH
jgi:hypothetical protein